MFRKPADPTGRPLSFAPARGEIYGHVFENAATGLTRDLYWNLVVEREAGDEGPSAFAVDWLNWPLRRWGDLDGMTLGRLRRPELVEASLYHEGEHHPAELIALGLTARRGASFSVAVTAAARLDADSASALVPISFACRVAFSGVFVVTENLQPRPTSPALAAAAVAEFIAVEDLRAPRAEGWRYVFQPLD